MQDLEKLVNEVKGSGTLGKLDYIVTWGGGGGDLSNAMRSKA